MSISKVATRVIRDPKLDERGAATFDLRVHFAGLASPTRFKMIERLAAAPEMRVTELAELCKVSQPRLSWHLRALRKAKLVRTRREGREVFCRLDREAIAAHLHSFERMINSANN